MEIIKSTANEKIKYIKKLKQKKYRDLNSQFIIEGEHLVEEALKYNALKTIVTTNYDYLNKDLEVIYVDYKVMDILSNYKSSSMYLGIADYLNHKLDYSRSLVVLDNIQDPGNVGTIMRNALAFDLKNIILSDNTVDIYNPKVIQASQGAFFDLNIKVANLSAEINILKQNEYLLIGTALNNSVQLKKSTENCGKVAFFFGNEGQGLSSDVLNKMDINYHIKINNIESLNVASASAIIFYQFHSKV